MLTLWPFPRSQHRWMDWTEACTISESNVSRVIGGLVPIGVVVRRLWVKEALNLAAFHQIRSLHLPHKHWNTEILCIKIKCLQLSFLTQSTVWKIHIWLPFFANSPTLRFAAYPFLLLFCRVNLEHLGRNKTYRRQSARPYLWHVTSLFRINKSIINSTLCLGVIFCEIISLEFSLF